MQSKHEEMQAKIENFDQMQAKIIITNFSFFIVLFIIIIISLAYNLNIFNFKKLNMKYITLAAILGYIKAQQNTSGDVGTRPDW